MKFRLMLLGFTAALLGIPDSLQAQKVIVNIWDGSERTVIGPLYTDGQLPNLFSVGPMYELTAHEDCFAHPCKSGDTVGCMKTVTKPQHATMLTGVLADVHGVFANRPSTCFQPIPEGLTVYEKIEAANHENRTAHISSKPMHFGGKTFGNIIDVVDLFFAQSVAPGIAADRRSRRLSSGRIRISSSSCTSRNRMRLATCLG